MSTLRGIVGGDEPTTIDNMQADRPKRNMKKLSMECLKWAQTEISF